MWLGQVQRTKLETVLVFVGFMPSGVDLHTAHWDYVLIYNFFTYNLLYSPTFKLRQCGQATEDVDRHLEKMDEETRWKMDGAPHLGSRGMVDLLSSVFLFVYRQIDQIGPATPTFQYNYSNG